MSDEIDRASDHEMAQREAAIRNAANFQSTLKPCGKCLNCSEEIGSDLRFCNSDCRDDFQFRHEEPARTGW